MQQTFSVSEIAEKFSLQADGHRALREAARMGALGPVEGIDGRTYAYGPAAPYRAALFMTLHRHVRTSASEASEILRHIDMGGLADAIEGRRRGERWAFDVTHVVRSMVPVTDFRPWGAPRLGTAFEASGPPLARTIVDLSVAWAAL